VAVLPTSTRLGKRAFDLAVAGVGLVALSPVIAAAALAVKLDSPGPAFYWQTRIGLGGVPFQLVKLRGMYVDSLERYPELYDYDRPDLNFYFYEYGDPRVTRVGRWLRRTSIDELPNLWNVLRGEMSIVGPRPDIPEMTRLYGDLAPRYLCVRPGVTCLAAYQGRDAVTKGERAAIDATYSEDVRVGRDLTIIWHTFGALFRGYGVVA
jgi:lipopolysaccharide/colanic/teichoic acid biosynthesis glycosyltransferase